MPKTELKVANMRCVGSTHLTAIRVIEKIKGPCPACGGPLQWREFIDSWDTDHKPMDINKDPYCPKCDTRWTAEAGPHHFLEE